jgi:hypothetical protein
MTSPTLIHESRDPSRRYCRRAFGHRHAPMPLAFSPLSASALRPDTGGAVCGGLRATAQARPSHGTHILQLTFCTNAIFGIRQSLSSEADSPPFGGRQERITC